MDKEIALKIYEKFIKCRLFEEKIVEIYPQGKIRCPVHLSIGQEGSAVGVCSALKETDLVYSNHRCHAHAIAKGASLKGIMAELYGKATGCCKGKGGSMHLAQPDVGFMGSSAIVGGNLSLATGAALAMKMQKKDSVVAVFFGDGAVEQGTFHESVNFSIVHELPILFICENNGLATSTSVFSRQPKNYISTVFYGIEGIEIENVHGGDVLDVFERVKYCIQEMKQNSQPCFLEIQVDRWKEHVGIEDCGLTKTKNRTFPVEYFKEFLKSRVAVSNDILEEIEKNIKEEIEEAVQFAEESPYPKPEALWEDL